MYIHVYTYQYVCACLRVWIYVHIIHAIDKQRLSAGHSLTVCHKPECLIVIRRMSDSRNFSLKIFNTHGSPMRKATCAWSIACCLLTVCLADLLLLFELLPLSPPASSPAAPPLSLLAVFLSLLLEVLSPEVERGESNMEFPSSPTSPVCTCNFLTPRAVDFSEGGAEDKEDELAAD